jgi:hypothetical protein
MQAHQALSHPIATVGVGCAHRPRRVATPNHRRPHRHTSTATPTASSPTVGANCSTLQDMRCRACELAEHTSNTCTVTERSAVCEHESPSRSLGVFSMLSADNRWLVEHQGTPRGDMVLPKPITPLATDSSLRPLVASGRESELR